MVRNPPTVLELAEMMAKPSRLLIIEDDEQTCNLIHRILLQIGCETDYVHTGEDGLLAVTKNAYAGILLDIRLPGMDGYALLQELKRLRIDIPVIVITGYPDENVYKLTETYGVLAIVNKPFSNKELTETLRRYLSIFGIRHDRSSPDRVEDRERCP